MEKGLLSHCILLSNIFKCQMFSQSRKGHWTVVPLWPTSLAKMAISEKGDRVTVNLLGESKHVLNVFGCKWIHQNGKWKRGMHYSSLLLIHVWYGCIYFNSFVNDELNFCGDYSFAGSSNNSPGDLSVSWKVGIWIGCAFRFSTKIGLKRAMAHWAVSS